MNTHTYKETCKTTNTINHTHGITQNQAHIQNRNKKKKPQHHSIATNKRRQLKCIYTHALKQRYFFINTLKDNKHPNTHRHTYMYGFTHTEK